MQQTNGYRSRLRIGSNGKYHVYLFSLGDRTRIVRKICERYATRFSA